MNAPSRLRVALVVFALDQLVKWIVTGPLGINQIGDQLVLLPIFNFTYTAEQRHLARPAQRDRPDVGRWMLVALTRAIAIGVALWIGREKNRIDQVALGMVLGGALGNILDRVAPRLCRRLRRPAFRRVPAVFGIQCRRCGD